MVPPFWVPVRAGWCRWREASTTSTAAEELSPAWRQPTVRVRSRRGDALHAAPPDLVLPGRHTFLSARRTPVPCSHTRSSKARPLAGRDHSHQPYLREVTTAIRGGESASLVLPKCA